MRNLTRDIEINGRTFTVRQLALFEIIQWLENPTKAMPGMEVVDALLLSDEAMAISDLLMISNATVEELKQMTEGELADLAKICREVNPRFFTMRQNLANLAKASTAN